MIKRNQIKGFSLKLFHYSLEFVFVNYFLRVIALSKHHNTIKRFEL